MSRSTETIIEVAKAGGGPIIIGEDLSADSVILIVRSTSAPVTVRAGNRSVDSLVRIVEAGGKRVTIDFS